MSRPRQPYCHAGHEFTPENTYIRPYNGCRICLTCNRLRAAKQYEIKLNTPKPTLELKDKCVRGHMMTPENTIMKCNGLAYCRKCQTAKLQAYIPNTLIFKRCRKGHELTPANTYPNTQACRLCNQRRQRSYEAIRKAKELEG